MPGQQLPLKLAMFPLVTRLVLGWQVEKYHTAHKISHATCAIYFFCKQIEHSPHCTPPIVIKQTDSVSHRSQLNLKETSNFVISKSVTKNRRSLSIDHKLWFIPNLGWSKHTLKILGIPPFFWNSARTFTSHSQKGLHELGQPFNEIQ